MADNCRGKAYERDGRFFGYAPASILPSIQSFGSADCTTSKGTPGIQGSGCDPFGCGPSAGEGHSEAEGICSLIDSLYPHNSVRGKPLSGRWKGFRRLCVGRVRVIYAFDGDELLVFIVRIAKRAEAYR